jgi:hypothetical protein
MFTKGNTLGKGRKQGSRNINTELVRTAFSNLVESNLEQLERDLKELEPKDRLKIVIELSKFILPTLKAVELQIEDENIFKPVSISFVNKKVKQ